MFPVQYVLEQRKGRFATKILSLIVHLDGVLTLFSLPTSRYRLQTTMPLFLSFSHWQRFTPCSCFSSCLAMPVSVSLLELKSGLELITRDSNKLKVTDIQVPSSILCENLVACSQAPACLNFSCLQVLCSILKRPGIQQRLKKMKLRYAVFLSWYSDGSYHGFDF